MSVETDRTGGAGPAGGEGRQPVVVVGVDGSAGSRGALVYALTAAARRGAQLEIVATFSLQAVWIGGYPMAMPAVATVREGLQKQVSDLVAEVRKDPAVTAVPGTADVRTLLVVSVGPPTQRLVDASAAADLLVVGSRGRGAVRSLLLGSVALHCVTQAHCPVVVVHPAVAGRAPDRTVVVGVDGSPASRAALRAGLAEAGRLGTDVAVVTTFEMVDHWMELDTVTVPSDEEVRGSGGGRRAGDAGGGRGRAPGPARRAGARGAGRGGRGAARRRAAPVGRRRGAAGRRQPRAQRVPRPAGRSVALACAMHGTGPVMVVHPEPARAGVPAARTSTAADS